MSLKIPNINGAKPVAVKFNETAKYIFSNLNSNDKKIATSIIDAVNAGINDFKTYSDETAITQIDLILGRIEDLLDEKIKILIIDKESLFKEIKYVLSNKPFNLTNNEIELIRNSIDIELASKVADITNFILDNQQTVQSQDILIDQQSDDKEYKKEILDFNKLVSEIKKDKKYLYKLLLTKYKVLKDSGKKILKDQKEKLKYEIQKVKQKLFESLMKFNLLKKLKDKNKKPKLNEFQKLKKYIVESIQYFYLRIQPKLIEKFIELNKMITKSLKLIANTLKVVLGMCIVIEFIMENIIPIIDEFENLLDGAITFIEKMPRRLYNAFLKNFPNLFSSVLAWWYGPPLYIGFILLGISGIIAATAYFITKYEPALKWVINWLLPFVANMFKAIATYGMIIIDALEKFMDWVDSLYDKALNFIKDFIFGFFRNIIFPVLNGVIATINFIKDSIWPIVRKIGLFVINTIITLVDNVIIPITSFLLNFLVNTFIKACDTVIFPILKGLLGVLNSALQILKPFIHILVNVIITGSIIFLNLFKNVILSLAKFAVTLLIPIINGMQYVYETFLKPIFNGIKLFFESLVSFPQTFIKMLMDSLPAWLIEGIAKMCRAIGIAYDAVANVLGSAISSVKSLFGFDGIHEDDRTIESARKSHEWLTNFIKTEFAEIMLFYKTRLKIDNISSDSFITLIDNIKDLTNFIIKQFNKIIELLNSLPNEFNLVKNLIVDKEFNQQEIREQLNITQEHIQTVYGLSITIENNKTDFDLTYEKTKDKIKSNRPSPKDIQQEALKLVEANSSIDTDNSNSLPTFTDEIINFFKEKMQEVNEKIEQRNIKLKTKPIF